MSTPGPKGAQELPAPEIVISSRAGDVLIKHTTLKADHFPSCHNTKLVPIMEGAPNFRQIPNVPVYGVAIPTVTGLRSALNAVGANKGARKVYWQNMREEPLVFINGNPFVVREADQPFCNLEYTGIDRSRVEDMERRLKEDILGEAAAFGNRILVKHENEDLSLYDHWEPVTAADVQTPNEVPCGAGSGQGGWVGGSVRAGADGYHIDYLRVPVTDEKAPKDSDFDMLIQRLWPNLGGAAFIFNCQATPPVGEQTKDKLKWGMYDVVRSLLRVLENGVQGKAVLDAVIDHCSQMQNLREASFADWMASRPELRSILMRLLRRNSMAALDLHLPVAVAAAGPEAPPGLPAGPTSGDVTAARSGAVLGPFTILKEDQFPGMRSHKVPQPIDGAPNFRGLPGMPIFGTGMPTIEGIVAVLRVVSGSTSPNASKRVHALWINMREEPVVYIKGRPFVLREEAHASAVSSPDATAQLMEGEAAKKSAFTSIHENPGAALAPVPVAKLPTVFRAASATGEDAADGAAADQRQVLARRKGRTLTKRTILKSYLLPRPHKPQQAPGEAAAVEEAEVPQHVQAGPFPVFSLQELEALLKEDVTHRRRGQRVEPFWEAVDPDSTTALLTPLELTHLAGDAAEDLRGEEAAALAGLGSRGPGIVVHLILSRTATGSSARFVAAACGTYLSRQHCFLDHSAYKLGGFADWVAQQPELHHLANHLTLDLP
eukprot:XP_001700224.1 predicted protein [Chlamydomonas reinhardtii]